MYRVLRNILPPFLLTAIVVAGAADNVVAWVVVENGFKLNEAQFNHWVYGTGQSGLDADSEIAVAVESIDRVCRLTAEQRDKLHLAGRGDFARFEQRVEEMRSKYADQTFDQNDIGRIHQEIHPLNVKYQAGLLGPKSLFSKSLRATLAPEQLEKHQAADAQRMQSRHDAKVRVFVASLERRCPLKEKQREALIKLLLEETRPPKRPSQLDHYVILVQLDRIEDDKFSAFMDAKQCRVLEKMVEQARGIEQHLKQEDVLP